MSINKEDKILQKYLNSEQIQEYKKLGKAMGLIQSLISFMKEDEVFKKFIQDEYMKELTDSTEVVFDYAKIGLGKEFEKVKDIDKMIEELNEI